MPKLTADQLNEYEQYFSMYRTLPVEVMAQLFAAARESADQPAEAKEAVVPMSKRVKKGTE